MALDVKTALDASEEGFRKSVANYRYEHQAAHYSNGFAALGKRLSHFVFLAVEKTYPFAVATYVLDDEALNFGAEGIAENIRTLAECVASGRWDAYPTKIQTLSLPPWAMKKR